jgi:pyridoxamine 5'-phosphate oxidase
MPASTLFMAGCFDFDNYFCRKTLTMSLNIQDLREEYTAEALDISDVRSNPIDQFRYWFEEAISAELPEPNAMTLATVSREGRPSARIVLLKGFDEEGFVFFTNYNSRKGRDMAANPGAALVFLWLELQRQVRIEGTVSRIAPEESTRYFQSRPKGSQIGAWASPQSQPIPSRELLEEKVASLEKEYAGEEVLPRPEDWGGYIVRPQLVEFWQGRPNRLHDRIQYTRQSDSWVVERLAP